MFMLYICVFGVLPFVWFDFLFLFMISFWRQRLYLHAALHIVSWATYRPLDGQGCQSHWMCGGGTPWDVQWRTCLLPRGTEPGSCNDTAFSPIWGLTVRQEAHTNTQTQTQGKRLITEDRATRWLVGRQFNEAFSPLTTSVSVRFWYSPCSWIRTRTVYFPASSSATSRMIREFPSMRYLEHCSAATMPSFNLLVKKRHSLWERFGQWKSKSSSSLV